MYQVGDLICYANMGVCKVTDISEKKVPGEKKNQLYYTLRSLSQECLIHTPVENPKVFMRPVISKKEAHSLIDLIPTMDAQPYHSKVTSQLTEHYTQSICSHDLSDLIELTMSIYAKRQEAEEQKRKFSVVDERFMRRAEDLLFGELSVALEISVEEVPAYIASRVRSLQAQQND